MNWWLIKYRDIDIKKVYRKSDNTYTYSVNGFIFNSLYKAMCYIDVNNESIPYSVFDFIIHDKRGTIQDKRVKGKYDWIINNTFNDEEIY